MPNMKQTKTLILLYSFTDKILSDENENNKLENSHENNSQNTFKLGLNCFCDKTLIKKMSQENFWY